MLDLLLIILIEEPPKPSEVKAGPLGFAVWMFMVVAVVFLGWSLTRQLRKAQANRDAGAFGDPPASAGADARPHRTSHESDSSSDGGGSDGGGGGGD